MCGIVGIRRQNGKYAEKLAEAWNVMKERGTDSFGCIIKLYNSNDLICLKSLDMNLVLKEVNNIDKNKDIEFIIGHNRKASVGGITPELAHPIFNKKYKDIIIHNGTKKEIVKLFFEFDSDTQAMLELIRNLKHNKNLLIQLLNNAGVVLYFDKNNDNIIFHKSNRSLYINKDKTIFASIPLSSGKWGKIKYTELKILEGINESIFDKLDVEKYTIFKYKKCSICKTTFLTDDKKKTKCSDCEKYYSGNAGWIKYYK